MIKTSYSALEMIELLQILSGLAWVDKHPDQPGFEGADLLADVPEETASRLAELTGIDAAHGLIAAIGGDDPDGRQIELHGCAADGEPQNWTLPLLPFSGFGE